MSRLGLFQEMVNLFGSITTLVGFLLASGTWTSSGERERESSQSAMNQTELTVENERSTNIVIHLMQQERQA